MKAMKYVIYYRVSTKKQGDSGLGLEAQRAYISHYISADQIAGEFTEVKSAKNIHERPQLQQAIDLCQKEGYTLAVAKIDRLSRKTEDALFIYQALNGRLFSCDIPSEGARMDKFILTIFMAIADRERELIGIRTKTALAAKKRTGVKLGNPKGFNAQAKATQVKAQKAKDNQNSKKARKMISDLIRLKTFQNESLTIEQVAQHLRSYNLKTTTGKDFNSNNVRYILNQVTTEMQLNGLPRAVA